jgi:hypothetical protein
VCVCVCVCVCVYIYAHIISLFFFLFSFFYLSTFNLCRWTCDLEKVKWDAFRNMALKLKNWRYTAKKDIGIRRGDTPEMVRARVGEGKLSNYHPQQLGFVVG